MKSSLFLALALGAVTAGCSATPRVLIAQADNAKIAQVQAGTLKEANASWWGFDKADATACLQAAIDSKVPTLIVDNTGSDWIINKPLNLVSHQQIIFADGVVVQAKEGAFKGKNDALFMGKNLTDIALIGQGNATLRMRRADYDNPKLYTKAEWRHGIGLWDCANVVIRGLTVTETGGDGLYLGASGSGTNKNVLVEDVNFDANYRQGISVISAEDLTIRRCKLTNTDGTNPQAGIDFEPNHPGQRLVNCVVEDSVLTGNKGGGLDVYAVNLNGDSAPISITVNRCTIAGNSIGMASTITRSPQNPATGLVTLNDCTFDHNRINLRNAVVGSARYLFKNCTLDFSPQAGKTIPAWQNVPITFTLDENMEERAVGGIAFDHTTVKMDGKPAPIALNFRGKANLSDQITGTLLVQQNGQDTPFDLAGFVREQQTKFARINALQPAAFDAAALLPPATGAARTGNGEFYTRNTFTFLQYARAGEQVTINVTARKVYDRETQVELHDPTGKKLETYTIPVNNKPFPITFTASETGIYRLVRTQDFSQRMDITSAQPGNGFLVDNTMDFLPLKGKLYFEVPAGVKEFTIGVATDSTADVALLNPAGQEVQRQNELTSLHLFSATRTDATKSEIWSLDVSNAVWAVSVRPYAPLNAVVSTNPETLLRATP